MNCNRKLHVQRTNCYITPMYLAQQKLITILISTVKRKDCRPCIWLSADLGGPIPEKQRRWTWSHFQLLFANGGLKELLTISSITTSMPVCNYHLEIVFFSMLIQIPAIYLLSAQTEISSSSKPHNLINSDAKIRNM